MLALEFITNEKEDKHVNNLFKISQQEFLRYTQNLHFGFDIKHTQRATKKWQEKKVKNGGEVEDEEEDEE